MVIANSTWVRPAQALIYSESGEVQYFPPRNRGRLPRALTFGDQQEWRHGPNQDRLSSCEEPHQIMSPFQISEVQGQEQDSYLITSESEHFHIEDPPEEYTSFESDYSRHSLVRDVHSYPYTDLEAPSMSTPTEQYINVLKRRGHSAQQSVLSSKQQPFLSSATDTPNGCMSPLLQSDSGPHLSLDDLVDLYTKKLQASRAARLSKDMQDQKNTNTATTDECVQVNEVARIDGMERLCDAGDHSGSQEEDSNCKSQNRRALDICNSLQLVTFDIQLFLQKLEESLGLDQQKKMQYEDWLCISTEELQLMLMNCCKETIELVMME